MQQMDWRIVRVAFFGGALLAVLAPCFVAAQQLPDEISASFPAALLSPALADLDAGAVVRADIRRFEVKNHGEAVYQVRRVVTILDARGRNEGQLIVEYDRLRMLRNLDGQIRDAGGKVIRKLKKSDTNDYSAISSYSLYDDNRMRVAELYHDVYPYTVEFMYELDFDGLIGWPAWYPLASGWPVEFTRYEVAAPADMAVRHVAEAPVGEPAVRSDGRVTTYTWTITAIDLLEAYVRAVITGDAASAGGEAVLQVASDRFQIERSEGDMSTWEGFGAWYAALSRGRDTLPAELAAEVARRTAGVEDPMEKARRIYTYHQESTRYVSVQLGIGGWQPFDAEYVYRNQYGDCKALTNYLGAMLRSAGLDAAPALIRNGRSAPDLRADFPSNQFNHVVVMLRVGADSLWLEATDATAPFGHIGAGNEDRFALLVGAEEGALVRTPRSPASANTRLRVGAVEVDATGNARVDVVTRYAGHQQQNVRYALARAPHRDRMDWLRRAIELPTFDIEQVDFSSVDRREDTLALPMTLALPRYASRTGTRLFVQPNLFERSVSVPPEHFGSNRPYLLSYAFLDVDSLRFRWPAGYAVETIPEPVDLDSSVGRYTISIEVESDGTLVYTRRLEIPDRRIPVDQYDAYRTFIDQVERNDRGMIVLVKQGS